MARILLYLSSHVRQVRRAVAHALPNLVRPDAKGVPASSSADEAAVLEAEAEAEEVGARPSLPPRPIPTPRKRKLGDRSETCQLPPVRFHPMPLVAIGCHRIYLSHHTPSPQVLSNAFHYSAFHLLQSEPIRSHPILSHPAPPSPAAEGGLGGFGCRDGEAARRSVSVGKR